MIKYYIATRLNRRPQHNFVRDVFAKKGFEITFDWTTAPKDIRTTATKSTFKDIAIKMIQAVSSSDIVVALLPGAFGTHVEVGMALQAKKNIIIHSKDKEVFSPSEKTIAFYYHDLVHQVVCPFEEFPNKAIEIINNLKFK